MQQSQTYRLHRILLRVLHGLSFHVLHVKVRSVSIRVTNLPVTSHPLASSTWVVLPCSLREGAFRIFQSFFFCFSLRLFYSSLSLRFLRRRNWIRDWGQKAKLWLIPVWEPFKIASNRLTGTLNFDEILLRIALKRHQV